MYGIRVRQIAEKCWWKLVNCTCFIHVLADHFGPLPFRRFWLHKESVGGQKNELGFGHLKLHAHLIFKIRMRQVAEKCWWKLVDCTCFTHVLADHFGPLPFRQFWLHKESVGGQRNQPGFGHLKLHAHLIFKIQARQVAEKC